MIARIQFTLAFTALVAAPGMAAVWHLEADGSGDAPTIQAAVDLAAAGDTIELACGTYYEHDIAVQSAITLQSVADDPACATIDAQQFGRVLSCAGLQGEIVCRGITFRNGYLSDAAESGGAISCRGGALRLEDCDFIDNYSLNAGGGLYCYQCQITVAHCRFIGNEGENGGGGAIRATQVTGRIQDCWFEGNRGIDGAGLFISHSSPVIAWCVFLNNDGWFFGGGMFCQDYSEPVLEHCTFVGNEAYLGSGIMTAYHTEATMSNSIVAFNLDGAGIHCDGASAAPSYLNLSCSDVSGNEGGGYSGLIEDQTGLNGNIEDDPLFCDVADGNLTLDANSPCLADNNSCAQLMGALGQGCSVVEVAALPSAATSLAVFPNPFNPRTTLNFTLPAAGHATLTIYDARGSEVVRLVDESLPSGAHGVDWTGVDAVGRALPSGTYFCRLTTSSSVATRKVQLVK